MCFIEIHPSFEWYHKGIQFTESKPRMTIHLTLLRNSMEKFPQTKTKTFQVENEVKEEKISMILIDPIPNCHSPAMH